MLGIDGKILLAVAERFFAHQEGKYKTNNDHDGTLLKEEAIRLVLLWTDPNHREPLTWRNSF